MQPVPLGASAKVKGEQPGPAKATCRKFRELGLLSQRFLDLLGRWSLSIVLADQVRRRMK
jgi:hypothetical protein